MGSALPVPVISEADQKDGSRLKIWITEIYANHLDEDTRDTTGFLNRYRENMSATQLETLCE